MKITDQPGRYFAVFILCPSLLIFSYLIYNNYISKRTTTTTIIIFTIIFFFYELFWILNYEPKEVYL